LAVALIDDWSTVDLIFVAHGEQRQPFAIAEAQRLTLDRVSVFKYNTIASVLTARAVREVAIRNCYLDSLIASLSVIEVVQAERVVVDQLNVYASIYAVGLSLRNVTGDIAIANATFLYTSGLQLALFFCDSAVVTVVDSAFLLGTATVLGGVINAEQVFALNIIDTVFLYNQAPTYACVRVRACVCGVHVRVCVCACVRVCVCACAYLSFSQ
jgi:hypothetical protein